MPFPSLLAIAAAAFGAVHDGPDPVASWSLAPDALQGGVARARLGPDARLEGAWGFVQAEDDAQPLAFLDGRTTRARVGALSDLGGVLPKEHLTLAAWVSVNTPRQWGGVLSAVQDDGGEERGWVLGYDDRVFTVGLSSVGADDGDGHLTYLAGRTPYEEGRLYHVVATYDGARLALYVNGTLEAETDAQSGPVLYPEAGDLVLGGYFDANESHYHHGRLARVQVFAAAAEPEWVADAFAHGKRLAEAPPYLWLDPEFRWSVAPYLQWVTQDGITVMWETSRPGTGTVEYGPFAEADESGDEDRPRLPLEVSSDEPTRLHEVRLRGLATESQWWYRVRTVDDRGRELVGPLRTFQTANREETPFTFVVLSDTQSNPEVAATVADLAWAQRPNFVLHAGDLVGTGTDPTHWTEQYFPSMRALIERVATFPVLGNHELDARDYYRYASLPDPEYHYAFRYGNAEFFLLDSNREVGPGSEQYRWLERSLRASKATWKLVCFHHPPYSSDDDYNGLWKGQRTFGVPRMRALVPLIDRFDVDLVWTGHVHSYERTWPLAAEKVVPGRLGEPAGGAVYMVTGGGGGSLETPGPFRPWFSNHVRTGHHFCTVSVNGAHLEVRAFDAEGRLFDTFTLSK